MRTFAEDRCPQCQKNLTVPIEREEERFSPKVLMDEPGYRLLLLSLLAGQSIPEHASRGLVAVYVILGRIILFAGPFPDELYPGQVISIKGGVRHRIEAFEDSALLVLFRPHGLLQGHREELDLCRSPRLQRHPLVFKRVNASALEGDHLSKRMIKIPVLSKKGIENHADRWGRFPDQV
jgi:quercetin dioxygenase-like cupin family protein